MKAALVTTALAMLKKSRIFRFLSSVKMAVPLMLSLGGVVAAGTFIEARYNAQVASLLVYRTFWFQATLGLLWINIFCATLSRMPFKRHHTGFVITHIGLLTLLIGAMITYEWGIDGSLRVVEGESSNVVGLQELVIKVARPESNSILEFPVKRALDEKNGEQMSLDAFQRASGLLVDRYLPFASKQQGFAPATTLASVPTTDGGIQLNFNLQSQFFNVDQTLHSTQRPEMQMGPATLILRTGKSASSSMPESKSESKIASGSGALLLKDQKSGKVLTRFSLKELKKQPVRWKAYGIELVRAYEHAAVDGGKLAEQAGGGDNPALELMILSGGQKFREVLFTKFPTFSLGKGGIPGVSMEYVAGATSSAQTKDIPMHSQGEDRPSGNVIEFHVNPEAPSKVRVELYKAGQKVLAQEAQAGETVQTPWMGMKITIRGVGSAANSAVEEVKAAEMLPKMPLLPSAIRLRSPDSKAGEGIWLMENEAKTINTSRGPVEVYYGMKTIELPFSVHLDRFEKLDYPGTETAMSFQSTIHLEGAPESILVKMNEPLMHRGFILYQSSYEMGQGQPTASIFSVNHDPGRIVKYVGAIILVLGIAIFTLMRSRWYQQFRLRTA